MTLKHEVAPGYPFFWEVFRDHSTSSFIKLRLLRFFWDFNIVEESPTSIPWRFRKPGSFQSISDNKEESDVSIPGIPICSVVTFPPKSVRKYVRSPSPTCHRFSLQKAKSIRSWTNWCASSSTAVCTLNAFLACICTSKEGTSGAKASS